MVIVKDEGTIEVHGGNMSGRPRTIMIRGSKGEEETYYEITYHENIHTLLKYKLTIRRTYYIRIRLSNLDVICIYQFWFYYNQSLFNF